MKDLCETGTALPCKAPPCAEHAPASAAGQAPSSHPIFVHSPAPAVGDGVALHFFEPRYRVLFKDTIE